MFMGHVVYMLAYVYTENDVGVKLYWYNRPKFSVVFQVGTSPYPPRNQRWFVVIESAVKGEGQRKGSLAATIRNMARASRETSVSGHY